MNSADTFPVINRETDRAVVFIGGKPVFAAQFLLEARNLAARLPDRPYVLNLATDRYRYLLGFCAAIIRGQCTLMPFNRLNATLELIEGEFGSSYRMDDADPAFEDLKPGAGADPGPTDEIPLDQLCAIAFTSGSTGTPTHHRKYWRTLVVSTASNARLLDLSPDETLNLVGTIPSQHMWGMETAILLPMLAPVAVNTQSPFYPADIVTTLAEMPEPRALVSSPVHLDALLRSGLDLPPLDRIFSATAPISQEQARRIEDRFSTRITEAFGCSETGIISGRETAREELWHMSDCLEIEAREGDFLVKGDHLPGPVVLPDSIEMHGDRRFRWIGRHRDMIKIGGKRESLSDLNLKLTAIDGIDDGVIFMPDPGSRRPAALIVSQQLGPQDVRSVLGKQVDAVFLPRPIFLVKELPRQETGKIARRELIAAYEGLLQKAPVEVR